MAEKPGRERHKYLQITDLHLGMSLVVKEMGLHAYDLNHRNKEQPLLRINSVPPR